jgi:hypothetical protein
VTVDKVFVGLSSESLPATNQRTAYVAVTRGKEQAQIFTDDRYELLRAMKRLDNPMSATELAGRPPEKPTPRRRPRKPLASRRGVGLSASIQPGSLSTGAETGDRP